MSSAPLPHQQSISGTYATNGSQAFAGVVHGNIYYGARECPYTIILSLYIVFRLCS